MKGKVSNTGYKKNSKDKNNDYNIIPTNRITMKNVDFPVLGISDKNDVRVMYPGEEHLFDGNSVLEYRMAKNGINQQDQKVDEQLKQLTDFSNNSLKVGGNIKKSNIMKDQILKIAGVKSEKEFYKKYPSEEAFMKVHGKEFKKAQMGAAVTGGSSGFKPISYSDQFDQADKMITGSTAAERQALLDKQKAAAPQDGGGGGGFDIGGLMKMFGSADGEGIGDMASSLGGARYGTVIRKAYGGEEIQGGNTGGYFPPPIDASLEGSPGYQAQQAAQTAPQENGWTKTSKALGSLGGPVGEIIGGIGALKQEKEAAKAAKQTKLVSDVSLQAAESTDVDARRQMQDTFSKQRNAMMQPMTGENLSPVNGVGTNVLGRNGLRLQEGGVAGDTNDYEPVDVSSFTGNPDWSINNDRDIEQITEYTDPNEMTDSQASSFMENYNRDQGKSTPTFDSNSARDTWVNKTGLPWSEAKRLGYTGGSAKDNSKLLAELNDPRFKKENLRESAPNQNTQSRTPIQHRETPTGRLTPIKKPLQSYAEAMKGKPTYKGNNATLSTDRRFETQREQEAKRSQAEYDDQLGLELPLYYMANPSKAIGDLKSLLNPMFTSDDETSKGFRKEVMANRYNPNQTSNKRLVNHIKKGLKLTPEAAANVATALLTMPYTTFEPLALSIGEGVGTRAAGYLGQGARQIGQGAAKQLSGKAAKQLGQGYVPNFTMRKDGGPVGGNPGEIQNTFAPNDIYTDSGYEPLSDSEIVKQYYYGGNISQAKNGFANWQNSMSGKGSGFSGAGGASGGTPWGAISHTATGMGQSLMGGQNAGGQIGGTAGKAIGSIFGPVGGAIGEFVGGIAGNALDPYAKRIKKDNAATQRNMQGMANVSMAKGINAQTQSFRKNGGNVNAFEDGGWVSNDWQPQVIASFGGLDEQEVYDYAHEGMDTLRAGGHLRNYTPPSERAMEIYEDGGQVQSYGLGGELQTHWGGGAETISRNPYLPGTGETVMFRGKSHEEYSPNGETGIGVTYGGNPVEVERGEPMVELEEGGVVDPMTGEVQKSGVVFGNLKIPNQYIDMLGDKNAKGKKFKNYVNDLSKIEDRQNTLIEKSTKELDGLTPRNSFDKLKLTALQASIQGANMKLKELADKKINAASLQNAINDTAEENGLVADDLARGKVKIDKEAQKQSAKFGGKFTQAQNGDNLTKDNYDYLINLYDQAEKEGKGPTVEKFQKEFSRLVPEKAKEVLSQYPSTAYGKSKGLPATDVASNYDQIFGKRTKAYRASLREPLTSVNELKPVGLPSNDLNKKIDIKFPVTPTGEVAQEEEESKFPWQAYANQALQYLRPSDQEGLDASQLYPEMYAMSTNQLEPVQANFYRPELGVPYDISLQDQLNANQADYRAAQRTMGYNPAAQANLNAQKYQANQGILGEQFRANQAMKDRVYGENRNILNDAKLKNLAIADQQYTRQAEAMSNTKATTQAALNSIADKYAKNKLENRTLGVYENMYNYRYDSKGRAINMNPLAQFNTEMGGKTATAKDIAPEGYEYETILKKKKKADAKNGSIVKSYKNL